MKSPSQSFDAGMAPAAGGHPPLNRLAQCTSPYLLQHAHNPVDWYPWGAEAFEKARREDKPIFLSIGYAACHWCHVMAHESFENARIADLLNRHFVAVKVDREERPDLDEIYMLATQLVTGRGGWPNSVWLTPDRRPFHAGTYFPAEDTGGRPGFGTLLARIAQFWTGQRTEVESMAERLAAAIRDVAARPSPPVDGAANLVRRAVDALAAEFDGRFGGFGTAPKFPPHTALALLLAQAGTPDGERSLRMAEATLDAMALGGLHDHVGGGFHRYSTDSHWLVPHFEKMLYDNAQLAALYAASFRVTGRAAHRDVAADVCAWVLREMRDDSGAFHASLDADSEGGEGRFYVWTRDEVAEALGIVDGLFFCDAYRIADDGNYLEESTGLPTGLNIPHLTAFPAGEDAKRLAACRARLLEVRNRRGRPAKDHKILASWNGLMIGALARCGEALGDRSLIRAAEEAATAVLTGLRSAAGDLLHTGRAGDGEITGFLDDYAFLADGLLDLAESGAGGVWRDEATRLADRMVELFHDEVAGGFFHAAAGHDTPLARMKGATDRSEPCANAIAARVLLRLDGEDGRRAGLADRTFRAFADMLRRAPSATAAFHLVLAEFPGAAPGCHDRTCDADGCPLPPGYGGP